MDILVEGLSLETPIFIVTEGHEPPFFTHFFEWDSSKANMRGNSFERKLALLKGKPQNLEVSRRNSWKAYSRETTPDSSRSQSVISNGQGSSASPATRVSGSNSMSSSNHLFSRPAPIARKLFSGSSLHGSPEAEQRSPSQSASYIQVDGSGDCVNFLIYPYERLKVMSNDPVADINVTKREAYLSDEEFQGKFGMTKGAFYELPKWRQNKLKMSLNLF
ncbi:villin-1-like [Juglans regia]|nr:villin-1-like [Juglans regia]